MTDEPALLRAIHANPDDDLARIVYADWLDEHAGRVGCPRCSGGGKVGVVWSEYGETVPRHDCPVCSGTGSVSDGRADRAEFIRVQVELAKVLDGFPPDNIPCIDMYCDPQDHANQAWKHQVLDLYARASALLAARGREWSQPVMEALGVTDFVCHDDGWFTPRYHRPDAFRCWRFGRGFVEAVRVPTMAEFMGGECPSCHGIWGRLEGTGSSSVLYDYAPCQCKGSGRLPGLAPRLGAVVGVREVVVGDREPLREDERDGGDRYRWVVNDDSAYGGRYPSRETAMSALAVACASYCRSLDANTPA